MPSELYTIENWPVSTNVVDPSDSTGKKKIKKTLREASAPKFVPTPAGLQAAVEYFDANGQGGIAYVIDRLNTQVATDARNKIRSEFTRALKGPDEEVLFKRAVQEVLNDEGMRNEAIKHGFDMDWIRENLAKPVMERLRAEYTNTTLASVPDAVDDTNDEDNNG